MAHNNFFEEMKETLDLGDLTTFEIREACSTIEFYELENVHKGDIIFECYKYRSIRTKVISEPQKKVVESNSSILTAWEWDAEIIEVYDYKWIDGKYQITRVDHHKKYQHYYVSDITCQGSPNLYTEDIYQYMIES